MGSLLQGVDDFLRGRGVFASEVKAAGRLAWLLAAVLVGGLMYGVVMGTYSGLSPGRYQQLLYSGLKVPLLLLATFAICLPTFLVLNTLAGLRDDFAHALRAVVAAQSGIAICLPSLAPFTVLFYLSCADYRGALLFNGLMFGLAWAAGQVVMRRYYAVLIRRDPAHRTMLNAWLVVYVFVGIQMAWVLRPFVGDPGSPVAFLREGAWGNAYVVVGGIVWSVVRSIVGG
jgi:hypothetical protein